MLKVAICDDIKEYIKKMEIYIEQYGAENSVDIKISSYISGDHLMQNYTKKKFDVIFLDISMPKMDGFEVAGSIREIDRDTTIIFCTSFYTITNAQRAYDVEARDFLKKPVTYKKIAAILDKIYKRKLINAEEKFILKIQEGIFPIQLSDIIYLETKDKAVVLHTVQRDFVTYQTMQEFENKLGEDLFFRCHTSFLVNLDYIEAMRDKDLVLLDKNKTIIPFSKYSRKELLKHLAKRMGERLS